jgi:large subunit ribosomal protein L6
MPIAVPKGVKITLGDAGLALEGPAGKLHQSLPPGIRCEVEGDVLRVARSNESKLQRSLHGLAQRLVSNAVQGVAKGFTRDLQIEGIGYRAQLQGRELHLTLGYSHPVVYPLPDGIQVKVDAQTKISVSGVNRQQVGQVAAEIRALRPPEPYKGKGIKYVDEHIQRKVGKTGA